MGGSAHRRTHERLAGKWVAEPQGEGVGWAADGRGARSNLDVWDGTTGCWSST